jgi:hypothetical protein
MAFTMGCAGPSPSPTRPSNSASTDAAGLAGKWRGYYRQVNAGDTGYVHGDIDLRIDDNGTYVGTWSNRQVAGSTRAGRTDMAGTIVLSGNQVILRDWRDLILKRDGDMLYGLTIDPGSGRTLSVYLERVP